jgi:hypothetical protein
MTRRSDRDPALSHDWKPGIDIDRFRNVFARRHQQLAATRREHQA